MPKLTPLATRFVNAGYLHAFFAETPELSTQEIPAGGIKPILINWLERFKNAENSSNTEAVTAMTGKLFKDIVLMPNVSGENLTAIEGQVRAANIVISKEKNDTFRVHYLNAEGQVSSLALTDENLLKILKTETFNNQSFSQYSQENVRAIQRLYSLLIDNSADLLQFSPTDYAILQELVVQAKPNIEAANKVMQDYTARVGQGTAVLRKVYRDKAADGEPLPVTEDLRRLVLEENEILIIRNLDKDDSYSIGFMEKIRVADTEAVYYEEVQLTAAQKQDFLGTKTIFKAPLDKPEKRREENGFIPSLDVMQDKVVWVRNFVNEQGGEFPTVKAGQHDALIPDIIKEQLANVFYGSFKNYDDQAKDDQAKSDSKEKTDSKGKAQFRTETFPKEANASAMFKPQNSAIGQVIVARQHELADDPLQDMQPAYVNAQIMKDKRILSDHLPIYGEVQGIKFVSLNVVPRTGSTALTNAAKQKHTETQQEYVARLDYVGDFLRTKAIGDAKGDSKVTNAKADVILLQEVSLKAMPQPGGDYQDPPRSTTINEDEYQTLCNRTRLQRFLNLPEGWNFVFGNEGNGLITIYNSQRIESSDAPIAQETVQRKMEVHFQAQRHSLFDGAGVPFRTQECTGNLQAVPLKNKANNKVVLFNNCHAAYTVETRRHERDLGAVHNYQHDLPEVSAVVSAGDFNAWIPNGQKVGTSRAMPGMRFTDCKDDAPIDGAFVSTAKGAIVPVDFQVMDTTATGPVFIPTRENVQKMDAGDSFFPENRAIAELDSAKGAAVLAAIRAQNPGLQINLRLYTYLDGSIETIGIEANQAITSLESLPTVMSRQKGAHEDGEQYRYSLYLTNPIHKYYLMDTLLQHDQEFYLWRARGINNSITSTIELIQDPKFKELRKAATNIYNECAKVMMNEKASMADKSYSVLRLNDLRETLDVITNPALSKTVKLNRIMQFESNTRKPTTAQRVVDACLKFVFVVVGMIIGAVIGAAIGGGIFSPATAIGGGLGGAATGAALYYRYKTRDMQKLRDFVEKYATNAAESEAQQQSTVSAPQKTDGKREVTTDDEIAAATARGQQHGKP